jgi:fatty-acyl-CoA synthase
MNIFSYEIEKEILEHESVLEVVVFGVPVNEFEQEICAWVKLKSSHENKVTISEIKEFCDKRLEQIKRPKFIKFVQEFPLNQYGKYMRFKMTSMYREELNDLLK